MRLIDAFTFAGGKPGKHGLARRRARKHEVSYRFFIMHPSGEDLAELARLVDAGAVKVILDSVYPFERICEAMAKLESGHAKGKIIVTMPDCPAVLKGL